MVVVCGVIFVCGWCVVVSVSGLCVCGVCGVCVVSLFWVVVRSPSPLVVGALVPLDPLWAVLLCVVLFSHPSLVQCCFRFVGGVAFSSLLLCGAV